MVWLHAARTRTPLTRRPHGRTMASLRSQRRGARVVMGMLGARRPRQLMPLVSRRHLGSRRSAATAASVDFVTSQRNERRLVAFGHLKAAQTRAAVLMRARRLSVFRASQSG